MDARLTGPLATSADSQDRLDENDPLDEQPPITDAVAKVLVDHHRKFLAFLEKRVESRATAEEILQAAFVKSLEKGGQLRDGESAVAWFYRLLRNAVIDHYRHRGAESRALEKESLYALTRDDHTDGELESTICGCLADLVPTLKPEYESILRAVDLDGRAVSDVARELGISANNASVRLHRARQALKKRLEATCSTCAEHGCLDCECEAAPGSAPGAHAKACGERS